MNNKGSDTETAPAGRREISTCGIRYTEWDIVTGFTETKRTEARDETNGFSRSMEQKIRGHLVGVTGAEVFVAAGCSILQALTQGKDPGLKKVY